MHFTLILKSCPSPHVTISSLALAAFKVRCSCPPFLSLLLLSGTCSGGSILFLENSKRTFASTIMHLHSHLLESRSTALSHVALGHTVSRLVESFTIKQGACYLL